ncbi:3-hydroxyacyl-CoA dehydrogenase NAD-binding domain-containing protein [Rhodococcus koreensis]
MSTQDRLLGASGGSKAVEAAVAYAKRCQERASEIEGLTVPQDGWRPTHAAVIGAGTMGGGIAMALADAGVPVALVDRDADSLRRGTERIATNYGFSVRRRRITEAERDHRMALISGSTDMSTVADADLVIEAVYEDLELKTQIFEAVDAYAPSTALLGTNTSALDIDAIASSTSRPDRVIGTHFFSPANVMKLLEVVPGTKTSSESLRDAVGLGKLLGKVAVRAGNSHGFIGNAMLADYSREAYFLIEEGAFPSEVDRVLTEFGFAMGLFTVGDMAGLDVGIESRRKERDRLPGGRRYPGISLLPADLGRLGQKTGAGWYRYEKGDRTPHRDPEMEQAIVEYSARIGITRREISDDEILLRCLCALVNRGAWLLQNGVAAKSGDIDAVYVTGYGFPIAQGGPLYWADSRGLRKVLADIERFRSEHGEWWAPAPLLVDLAECNATFSSLGTGDHQ